MVQIEKLNSELEKTIKRKVFTESYYEFFKWAFEILEPDNKLELNFHLKFLCDLLQDEAVRIEKKIPKNKDIIINISPRASKSMITSICYNAWVWIRNPSARFICISYDEDLALSNATKCRDIIESPEYVELFGHIYTLRGDSNAKGLYANNKGGQRLSKTIGSNVTGQSGLFIIVDDPQNPKTALSEIERAKVNYYYAQQLYNRLTPLSLGVRVIIQQRLHERDLTGTLLKKAPSKYLHINLPSELTEHVKPEFLREKYTNNLFDPIRLDENTLSDLRDTLGSNGYSGQYLQNPINLEGGIIKPYWFNIIEPHEIVRDVNREPIDFFMDTAYTEKTSNDPTAILGCFIRGRDMYITVVAEKRLDFPNLLKFTPNFVKEHGYSLNSSVFVEPKASGISVVQTLKNITSLNIIQDKAPREDKITRLNSISPIIEAKRVNLIRGGWNDAFISQVCSISPDKAPPHDDMADVLIMAIKKRLVNEDFLFM